MSTRKPSTKNFRFLIFGVFNHVEILCASLILTGTLILSSNGSVIDDRQVLNIFFTIGLLMIALAYTYQFTPHLAGWGLSFNPNGESTPMPEPMMYWQGGYWLLELIKITIVGILLKFHYRRSCSVN